MSDIVVRPLGTNEITDAACVLAAAFANDEQTVAAVGRPRDPERVLGVLFESAIRRHYLHHGAVDVADEDGAIAGVAVWAAPGGLDFDRATYGQMFRDTACTVHWRLLPLLVQLFRSDRVHPKAPHWYLYALGVALPGRRVGGRLLDHGIARAGDVPCYLEASTPDSARLYERKGFVRIGAAPTPPGCSLRRQPQMWRDPRW